MQKDWAKRPFDHQLQEAQKKTDRVKTSATEAACVPAQWAPPGFLQTKQLHHLHDQLSLVQSCHRQKKKKKKKKKSCVCACWVSSVLSNSLWLYRLCHARLLCHRGGSPGKDTGIYWLILTAISFYYAILTASLATTAPHPEYLNPCHPSSCTTSAPDPQRGKPKLFRVASGANPSG